MIVIAIVGTLAGIAVPILGTYLDRVKVTRAKIEIRTYEKEILTFYFDNDRYPVTLSEIGLGGVEDPYGNPYQYMPAPIAKKDLPKGGKGNKGGNAGTNNAGGADLMRKDHNLVPVNTDYDLYSMGKDGKTKAPFTAEVSQDDIVRANNGQFIGLVSAY